MSHRGPDDSGVYRDEKICLGHRRLAIQDLSPKGHQPMELEDPGVCIVFNGEIYNHQDIRSRLGPEIRYRGSSDTETLLYAYLKYGIDLPIYLNGIFAFAIYDQRWNKLFVARDQLGIKPLYYYCNEGQLLFSSELKAISSLKGIDRSLNPQALVDYMNFLWSPGEKTPFQHFKKLEAGHYFVFDLNNPNRGIEPKKYYELPYNGRRLTKNEAELTDELDQLLCQAVQRQLLSDVPVGFFLSGGLDSSLITAIARKQIGTTFNCYTIDANTNAAIEGFEDDLHYAKLVAEHLDVNLSVVEGDSDIVRDFDRMIWHLDEPQADPAPLHVWNICRAARNAGDIVLLGGTAGDDLFSGYRRHQALSFERWLGLVPGFIGTTVKALAAILPKKRPMARRLQKLLNGLGESRLQRMAGYFAWIDLKTNKSLFDAKFQDEINSYCPSQQLIDSLQSIPDELSPLNQMLFWDTKYFLTDHNLNYTDKMSMAAGVEVRVPFLDLDLVEFACKLPVELKLHGKTTKYLLKKVAERYLPHEVIYRPKSGFGAPVRQWVCEGKFDSRISQIGLANERYESVFSASAVRKLLDDTKSGKIDGSYTIWSVLAIDSWQRQFTCR